MYQHGKKSRRKSNPKVLLHAAVLLGVSLIVVAWILHKDLTTSTEKKTTVPIVTNIAEEKKDVTIINEPLFTFELPSDWKQTNRVQSEVSNYYEWHSTKPGADDRRLMLHVDIMPQSYKVNKMQPISANGSKLIVGNLSDNCVNFVSSQVSSNAPVQARWENVTFICDPIVNNQTIGTGSEAGGIATSLAGSGGTHKYFFYYEDHNIRPDSAILTNLLKSFSAR